MQGDRSGDWEAPARDDDDDGKRSVVAVQEVKNDQLLDVF